MKPTIYDVARAAGVSTATVSKVINGTGRISDKTRKRVTEIMEELRYQPSMVAAALTRRSTSTVGLMLPDLANPYFAEIARAVEDRGHEFGFSLLICSTDNDPSKEEKYLSLMVQKCVDGIMIATSTGQDGLLRELAEQRMPIVAISRELPSLPVDTVMVDDFMGGYMAGKHLVGLGHRRIGIIAEKLGASSSPERIRGCRQAMAEAGIEADDSLIAEASYTVDGGRKAAARLLGGGEPPTALFACNDVLAIGALQAAFERGLQVPEQLSVVGFDNTMLATITAPPLTTVSQPIQDIGRRAFDALLQEIRGEKRTKQRLVLLPELVVRRSTAPVAGGL
ncbi:transcriptional regulator [Paenibacillus sp. 32O-W]|uniref:HTH-type transcriptional regulator DegA n=1 Tax=Paenibacillus cisolokensis TaxID=1658519 RepID=A0ABQ4NEE5_9BACL|nr:MULTISPECIES: LacI family DNA-binding transcriptional regulator [Paenibacillus]ALS27647.1 transcriptional regulator [Paenibacillus sp. 32O-W]GIQ66562.1 HTH-type transcriptional regulator DegA [Paenibacillus cisolokensis]